MSFIRWDLLIWLANKKIITLKNKKTNKINKKNGEEVLKLDNKKNKKIIAIELINTWFLKTDIIFRA